MNPELSVVVPMFNEEKVIPLLVERLRPTLDSLGTTYEVVAVDDGSTDDTVLVVQRYRREWPQLRLVRLRANSGHQAAISAGLTVAKGDYLVTIDADLQDPPETIADMLEIAHREGVDVVYGVRADRSTDTAFKRATAGAFYKVHHSMTGMQTAGNAGDFRLMSRATVEAALSLPEQNRVLRFVVPALGFPSATVEYKREERAAGESKYPLSKMILLSLDSIIGFSLKPLRLATWAGFGGFFVALLFLGYAVIGRFTGHAIAGWASTLSIIALFGGVQLLCLGIIGEYLGRLYLQMQARPTFYVAYDSDQDSPRPGRTGAEPSRPLEVDPVDAVDAVDGEPAPSGATRV